MGNLSKWLVAVPFIGLWTLGLPALIAGRLDWFLADPWDVVFVLLWAGAFAAGTQFYQPARHRRRPGRTRLVFSLATLVAPLLAIYDWCPSCTDWECTSSTVSRISQEREVEG